MTEHFIFDVRQQDAQRQRTVHSTVVFCPQQEPDEIQLRGALKLHFDERQVPDHVILLGTSANEEPLRRLTTSEPVLAALPRYTEANSPSPIYAITGAGDNFTLHAPDQGISLPSPAHIRESGIYHLFTKYEALLTVGPQFHYEKKSGWHSYQFIRAANILIHGPEIAFVAFWLLPHLTDDITHIYTDTPAIHALAYAAVDLKRQITPSYRSPLLSSFGSYDGIDQTTLRGTPLVIVSATTSGNLQEKIQQEKNVPRERIITLLFGGANEPEGTVLCNLAKLGVPAIENYASNRCPLCDRKVPTVKISGEHFLPETPPVRVELIKASDSPQEIREFATNFTQKEYLRANHQGRRPGEPNRELFIDVRKVFDTSEHALDRKLTRVLQKVPATLQRIIHQSDPGSERLAQRVQQIIRQHLNRDIQIVNHKDIVADLHTHTRAAGTTLVVAGAISSGKTLIQISQLLRVIQTNGAVQYLIGFAKTRNKDWLNELKSDLQFGEYAGEHECHILQQLYLPQDSLAHRNAWEQEILQITLWRERLTAPEEQRILEARKVMIEKEQHEGGLLHDLLWPAPSGSRLALTEGFTFWSHRYDPAHVSQADVYFTVAAVLHRLRYGMGRFPAWSQQLYQRVLLNPSNFTRFTDGLIQASLVRAAHTSELDYSISPAHSEQMADILENMFQHMNLKMGEASLEFLCALAAKRLCLCRQDLRQVIGSIDVIHPTAALFKKILTEAHG